MQAACELVSHLGGEIVGCSFVVELCFLPGREKISQYDVHALLQVQGE
jgi:adenine phosphoribosyltransferase